MRRGKGTLARDGLIAHIDTGRRRHAQRPDAGRNEVNLPHALRAKIPTDATSLTWQYLFPASHPCTDPATGRTVLYHLHEPALRRAVRDVANAAGFEKRATCHPLRRSFAPQLLEARTESEHSSPA